MPSTKTIHLLAPADSSALTDETPIYDTLSGITKRATNSQLVTLMNANVQIAEGQVTNLTTDLASKALDSAVVHKTGNESIGGVKTFTSTITGNISGNSATVTTNANLTGPVTSTGNATAISSGVVTNTMLAGSITASKLVQTDITLAESQITNLTSDLAARIVGPGSSVDGNIALFNGVSGVLEKDSGIHVDASRNVTGINNLTMTGALTLPNNCPTIVFISPTGVDAVGNGSYNKPYATISYAESQITTATPANPYTLFLTGNITDTGQIYISPNINVYAISQDVRVTNSLSIIADPRWNTVSSGFDYSYWQNVAFYGNINVDFSALTPTFPFFQFIECYFALSAVTINGYNDGDFPGTSVYFYDCYASYSLTVDNCYVYSNGNQWLSPVNYGTNTPLTGIILYSFGDWYQSNVTFKGQNAGPQLADFYANSSCRFEAAVTIDGANATFHLDPSVQVFPIVLNSAQVIRGNITAVDITATGNLHFPNHTPNLISVSKNGSDTFPAGDGTAWQPYLTVVNALSHGVIFSSVINITPGIYAEADFSLRPDIGITGAGRDLTTISTTNITLNNTEWTATPTPTIDVQNLALLGTTFNLNATTFQSGSMYRLNNVNMNETGCTFARVENLHIINGCQTKTLTITDIPSVIIRSSDINETLNITSVDSVSVPDMIIYIDGSENLSTITVNNSAATSIFIIILNCPTLGSFTATSAGGSISLSTDWTSRPSSSSGPFTYSFIDKSFPLSPTSGGTGVLNPTAHGILVAEGSSAVTPIVLGAGQVLIGTTASDPSANSLAAGAGIGITSASGSITIASNGLFKATATPYNSTATLSASDIFKGLITSSPAVSATLTFPTASSIYTAMGSPAVQSAFSCLFVNTGAGVVSFANTDAHITVVLSSTTIATTTSKLLYFVVTNAVTPVITIYG